MLISDVWPIEQIQLWKNDYNYNANDIVCKVREYMNAIHDYEEKYSVLKMESINNLYNYLNKNPEFLCHTPLFLKQSNLRAIEFLNELETIKKHITDELYKSVLDTLKLYIDLSIYIELI
jgi:hypothetical protein